MTYDFRDANIDRSAIGDRATVHNYGGDQDQRTAELLATLADLRERLLDAEPDPARRAQLDEQLDRVEDAAGEDGDAEVLHSRWERVLGTLEPATRLLTGVTRISELVRDLVTG